MTTEQDPRPLDALDGEAPESLARALRALGGQRPTDAFLRAAALRLGATVQAAPRGAPEAAKAWAGPGTKLLAGKLVAVALVLGGATLALRSAAPIAPGSAAQLAKPAQPAPSEARAPEVGGAPVASSGTARPAVLPAIGRPPVATGASPGLRHDHALAVSAPRSPALPHGTARATHATHGRGTRTGAPSAAALSLGASAPSPVDQAAPSAALAPPASSAPLAPLAPSAALAPPASSAPLAPLAPSAALAPPASPSEVELLLDAKRRAGSDPEATLRAVAEHTRRFPDGALAPEREVLAIEALRALGRSAEADQRLRTFQARYPRSIHTRGLSPQAR